MAPRPKTKTIIGRSTYDRLWDEAATRVEADMALHEAQLDEFDRLTHEEVTLSPATAASPAALATWLIRTYPGGIRGHGRNDPRGIYRRMVSRAQHDAAEALVHPTMEEVLPFIYLTTAFFALNAQVALGMTVDDYRLEEVPGGARRLRIFPDKPRADDRQRHAVAETSDPANPARFLPYLERRTAHLRRARPSSTQAASVPLLRAQQKIPERSLRNERHVRAPHAEVREGVRGRDIYR